MNKHNVVDLQSFVKDKRAARFEQVCQEMVDHMGSKLYEIKLYVRNFNTYIDNMVQDGLIKETFAKNLTEQVELISTTAYAQMAKR